MKQIKSGIIIIVMVLALILGSAAVAGKVLAADSGNISWGSQGSTVVQVQQILNNRGYWCGSADGIFGPDTYKAVVRFQKDHGISPTGIVGIQTQNAMGLGSSSASRGGYQQDGRSLTMVATGYDDSYECNYPFYGQPSYTGLPLARGIVATDPDVIPMGTRLYVEGYGEAIAADQGNAIQGNRIDLFFDSHTEAVNWGMRNVRVTVIG